VDSVNRYFIKSVISLLVLSIIFFLYLEVNIKRFKLNKELSENTQKYINLRKEISKLEIEYSKLTRNEVLEKKAVEDFDMRLPEASDIIRVNNE